MQVTPQASSKPENSAQTLALAAITAALENQWTDALKLNEKILAADKSNVEALNRLARAQSCLGFAQKAQKTYKKVLETDPYNIIALKNLEKLSRANGAPQSTLNGQSGTNGQTQNVNLSQVFLDEPGKTKLVSLINLAPPSTLAILNCGDQLTINPKNHSITVSSQNGTYLGAFPDDIAHKLLTFIAGGNQYEAYVKSSSIKSLVLFVRETVRSAKFGNQPSFMARSSLFDDDSKG